jgi:Glycosyl hydrolases family 31
VFWVCSSVWYCFFVIVAPLAHGATHCTARLQRLRCCVRRVVELRLRPAPAGVAERAPTGALEIWQCVRERASERGVGRDSRACERPGLGNQRYPLGFSGDTFQAFETLQYQIRQTKTAANVLFGWWSHDIGGFHTGDGCPGDGDPTNTTGAEMLLRWCVGRGPRAVHTVVFCVPSMGTCVCLPQDAVRCGRARVPYSL